VSEDRKAKFFYGYIVVVACFVITTVMFGTMYTFGVFFKPLLAELGGTRVVTSGAYSLCFLLFGFFGMIAGSLTDRFGPRLVITGCGLFLGLGYLLMSQASAIWQLYLFFGVIVGVGMGGAFVPLVSTVSRWFVKRRGMMTGIVVAGIGFGTIIMPPVANRLISALGWSTSYIILGIIALVVIIPAAQFLRRDPAQMGQLPDGGAEAKAQNSNLVAQDFTLRRAIHTRQFWMVAAMFLCFGFALQTIIMHIDPHATDLGIPSASAAVVLSVIGGGSIAGRVVMGSAADRIGNKLVLIICFILLSIALVWLLAAKELWMLYLFAAIFGFAYGGLVAMTSTIVAELFGIGSLGIILGFISLSHSVGGFIGPMAAGRIFDVTQSYTPAFVVCAGLSVIGVVLALLLKLTSSEGGGNEPKRSAGLY